MTYTKQTSRTSKTLTKYPKKRANEYESEPDSDRPAKKSKASFNAPIETPKQRKDGEGNAYWELNKTGNRRVTIQDFKGKMFVNIREYYEKDGEMLPGKKGIMMAPDQFSVLLSALPQIESALSKKGVSVPRPNYSEGGAAAKAEDEDEDDDEEEEEDMSEEESEEEPKPAKKKKAKPLSNEEDEDSE